MKFTIPEPLKTEHEHLHHTLHQATREPGELGIAAQKVADLMQPHFEKEEAFALPPLGALDQLARGLISPEMAEILTWTRQLEAELDEMLQEHTAIVTALEQLSRVAQEAGKVEYVQFAHDLIQHARTEELVTYPTVRLIGRYLKQKLPSIA